MPSSEALRNFRVLTAVRLPKERTAQMHRRPRARCRPARASGPTPFQAPVPPQLSPAALWGATALCRGGLSLRRERFSVCADAGGVHSADVLRLWLLRFFPFMHRWFDAAPAACGGVCGPCLTAAAGGLTIEATGLRREGHGSRSDDCSCAAERHCCC